MLSIIFILMAALSGVQSCSPGLHESSISQIDKAESLLAQGDTLEASRLLTRAVNESATNPAAYTLLGFIYRSSATIQGRLLSQRILEEGMRRFPGNPKIMLELGKTYYEQKFYGDAARCFRNVLDKDSTDCEALYYMGLNYFRKWKRNRDFIDELANARIFFSRASACDPKKWDWTFRLAFIDYALGDSSACRKECDGLIALWPDNPYVRLLSGAAYFYQGNYFKASVDYKRALANLAPPEREYYLDISLLLDPDQREKYVSAPPARKEEIRRSYWTQNDPDPTTPINELRLEHWSRIVLATMYFSDWNARIQSRLTDRAIALIKFGWPTSTIYDLGERSEGRWEKWYYRSGDNLLEFSFIDEFLNDRFSIPTNKGPMKQALDETPSKSDFESFATNISGEMRAYSFRNAPRSITVYLIAAVDGAALRSLFPALNCERLSRRSIIFDSNWQILEQYEDGELSCIYMAKTDSNLYFEKELELPFDNYHCVIAVEDSVSSLKSVFKADVIAITYLNDSLALSDIVLHKSRNDYSNLPTISRNGRRIEASIFRRFKRGDMLGVYFEIYGLKFRQQLSRYETSFSIYPAPTGSISSWDKISSSIRGLLGLEKSRSPSISQTITRSGADHTQAEDLLIDISSLEPGRYELEISVLDLISKQRCAGSSIFYKIVTD